jgi:hypothetical protein
LNGNVSRHPEPRNGRKENPPEKDKTRDIDKGVA